MAKAFIDDTNLTDIADAIRATLDESRQYLPSEMAAAIQSVPIMAQLNRKKYFQSVPAGAASGYATIEQIEGNTVVWNQLVDTNSTSVVVQSGHVYYGNINGTASIATSNGTPISVTGGTDIIHDLTLIFGAGNEPTTVAEFEAWRDAMGLPSVAAYNPGELISCKMNSVKSVGFNQWDEEWEVGSIDNSTGLPLDNDPNNIRSKNYCRCLGNKEYYVKGPVNIRYYFYDGNFSFLSGGYTSGAVVTTPTNAAYFKVRTTSSYGNTYNNDICVNLSDTAKNGTYKSYQSDSADIDVTTITGVNTSTNVRETIFPNGMKQGDREGTVKDELDLLSDTATVKGYDINLGNLQFTREHGTGTDAAYYFYSESLTPSAKNVDDNTIGKFLCSKYNVGATNNQRYVGSLPNLSVCVDYLHISIRDDNYSDAASFMTAMNGVHLIYELATPITYTDLQDANGNPIKGRYVVEHGGMEQVLPANTSTPTTVAPILSTIYKKNI